MDGYRYRDAFYEYVDGTAVRSATALLSRVDLGFEPQAVLDVGCGRGAWLAAWKARGAASVLGVDGPYVDVSRLKVSPSEFRAADLSQPFDVGRHFDLVQCLEVAEHLPEGAAGVLIASLVRHGDVVLFSAAPPGQGGEHHVNEQPREYWIRHFAACGFAPYDCIRPAVRGVSEIEPWYRYNALLFANRAGEARLSGVARSTQIAPGLRSRDFGSLGWRLRCGFLRRLPPRIVDALARARHRVKV